MWELGARCVMRLKSPFSILCGCVGPWRSPRPPSPSLPLLLVLLWRFWFRRNHAVHSAPLLSVEEMVGWSERFLVDFQAAVAVPSVRRDLVVKRWLAPSPGWVKINSDVAVDVRGRRLGFGVVIRDCMGVALSVFDLKQKIKITTSCLMSIPYLDFVLFFFKKTLLCLL
ncbi:hypothetical protein ACOSQ4_027766 [Xanthoceras sorbifolium]